MPMRHGNGGDFDDEKCQQENTKNKEGKRHDSGDEWHEDANEENPREENNSAQLESELSTIEEIDSQEGTIVTANDNIEGDSNVTQENSEGGEADNISRRLQRLSYSVLQKFRDQWQDSRMQRWCEVKWQGASTATRDTLERCIEVLAYLFIVSLLAMGALLMILRPPPLFTNVDSQKDRRKKRRSSETDPE